MHVFVVVLENHSFGEIIGSPEAPFLNKLADQGGLATNYTAIRHPSLPNYIAMIGGSTFGIKTNCTKCSVRASNLADQLENAGLTWRAYEESIPRPCFMGAYSGHYAKKHSPFLYFKNITGDAHRCKKHVVGFNELRSDINSDSLPNFSLIVPNEIHDMHSASIRKCDRFLKALLPDLLATDAFQQDGVLVVTWDEGTDPANHIATIVRSPLTPAGTRSNAAFNHYSLLKTIEEVFGLSFLRKAGLPRTDSMVDAFLS